MGLHAKLLVLAVAGALAGCGGAEQAAHEPYLEAPVADRLAASAERIAAHAEAGRDCEAADEAKSLQQETIAAINSGGVPPELQEELLAGVNRVASSLVCEPAPVPPPPPAPPAAAPETGDGDDDSSGGKGKKADKDKKGKRGRGGDDDD